MEWVLIPVVGKGLALQQHRVEELERKEICGSFPELLTLLQSESLHFVVMESISNGFVEVSEE